MAETATATADTTSQAATETQAGAEQATTQKASASTTAKAADSTAAKQDTTAKATDSSATAADGTTGGQTAPLTYTLTLPKDSVLDASTIERATAHAKALGLSQTAAQKNLEHVHAEVAGYVERSKVTFAETTKGWVDVVKADPELGGDKFGATIRDAAKPIERFFTPAFKKALNDTGFGNHPELVRGFARIGRAMADDTFVRPGADGSGGTKKSTADVLYGQTEKKE